MYNHLKVRRIRTRDFFKMLDSNQSGVLEPKEFLGGLQRLRLEGSDALTVPQLTTIFRTIDENFDGSISLLELERSMGRIARIYRANMSPSSTGHSWMSMSSSTAKSMRRSMTA